MDLEETAAPKEGTSTGNEETYITFSEDIVQLVNNGGQIQEVHLANDGSGQEIVYTLTNEEGENLHPSLLSQVKQEDSTFEIYDNARGKINTTVLTKLVQKHNADDSGQPAQPGQRQGNLLRWNEVVKEYNAKTGQGKSRNILMKRWAALKSLKKESKSTKVTVQSEEEALRNKNMLIKQLKGYDALRIEAAQLERNARKLEVENAQLENEALKKENEILDLQLEAARLEVEALKEQSSK